MPKRPPRKGFVPEKNCYLGFRDKVGQTFRAAPAVFVLVAQEKWGSGELAVPAGASPVQLNRFFAHKKDKLGAYRLEAQYLWCLNYAMLRTLGQYVLEKVPADILAQMAVEPNLVVVTNWGVVDEFQTLSEDVEMRGYFSPPPPPGAWKHAGTLTLALSPNGNLRKHGGCNYATAFRRWTHGSSLASMAPTGFEASLPDLDGLPQPCSADYSMAPELAVRVASGGGPDLPNGERVEVGADELEIRAVEYDADYAENDPLAGFTIGFAYITGNPYDDPVTAIEMIDHERLRAMLSAPDAHNPAIMQATRRLLDEPDFAKRLYLSGTKELLPAFRTLTFPRGAIRRSIISVNPTMTEGAALLRGDTDTYSFECVVRPGCALVPLRRCGESVARSRLPSLLLPSPRAMRSMAQVWLEDVITQKTAAAERNLDPLEFTVPCPYTFLVSLPCFGAMRRWLLPPPSHLSTISHHHLPPSPAISRHTAASGHRSYATCSHISSPAATTPILSSASSAGTRPPPWRKTDSSSFPSRSRLSP